MAVRGENGTGKRTERTGRGNPCERNTGGNAPVKSAAPPYFAGFAGFFAAWTWWRMISVKWR